LLAATPLAGVPKELLRGYGKHIVLPDAAPEWPRALLTDPQTSGGLLVACAPEAEAGVLAEFAKSGFTTARRIGRLDRGPPQLRFV
jgi:selenide,water dikinase